MAKWCDALCIFFFLRLNESRYISQYSFYYSYSYVFFCRAFEFRNSSSRPTSSSSLLFFLLIGFWLAFILCRISQCFLTLWFWASNETRFIRLFEFFFLFFFVLFLFVHMNSANFWHCFFLWFSNKTRRRKEKNNRWCCRLSTQSQDKCLHSLAFLPIRRQLLHFLCCFCCLLLFVIFFCCARHSFVHLFFVQKMFARESRIWFWWQSKRTHMSISCCLVGWTQTRLIDSYEQFSVQIKIVKIELFVRRKWAECERLNEWRAKALDEETEKAWMGSSTKINVCTKQTNVRFCFVCVCFWSCRADFHRVNDIFRSTNFLDVSRDSMKVSTLPSSSIALCFDFAFSIDSPKRQSKDGSASNFTFFFDPKIAHIGISICLWPARCRKASEKTSEKLKISMDDERRTRDTLSRPICVNLNARQPLRKLHFEKRTSPVLANNRRVISHPLLDALLLEI